MTDATAPAALLAALGALLDRVRTDQMVLETPGAPAARANRAEIADQLADYVVPRLVQLDAPLLVVVGGSTGAGKSTLVNSIVGEPVTESGVLRPTTRSPVLAHHPDDAAWFQPDRILPELPRTAEQGNTSYALRLRSTPLVPAGLAILDAPDVDSIDQGNRDLATQLLAAADLWLFVTSAARYADQVPWDYLRRAAERSTSVAVVLDRTSPDGVVEVRGHLARMMTARGLSDSPLFTVPETAVGPDGLLPPPVVAPIVAWLHDLARNDEARQMIVAHTVDGAVRHNVLRAHDLADAFDEQAEAAEELVGAVDRAFGVATESVATSVTDGSLVRGEVAARWQDFVGTGEVLRSVEGKVGRIRSRLVDGVTGKRSKADDVAAAVAQDLAVLLLDHAETAAASVTDAWVTSPAGEAIVAARPGLDRAPRDLRARTERIARDWQQDVYERVRSVASDKRLNADYLAFGVPGIGVSLMIAALGAEAPESTEALRVGRRVLDAIVTPQVLAGLVDDVAADLRSRAVEVVDAERRRFLHLVPDPAAVREAQSSLRETARRADYARHVDFLDEQLGTHRQGGGG